MRVTLALLNSSGKISLVILALYIFTKLEDIAGRAAFKRRMLIPSKPVALLEGDSFPNNILLLFFYKIKNIHTLKIQKCSLHYKEMLAYLSYTLHVD